SLWSSSANAALGVGEAVGVTLLVAQPAASITISERAEILATRLFISDPLDRGRQGGLLKTLRFYPLPPENR
ncbi:hypothetical protein, partial [Xanthomonas oryzae]